MVTFQDALSQRRLKFEDRYRMARILENEDGQLEMLRAEDPEKFCICEREFDDNRAIRDREAAEYAAEKAAADARQRRDERDRLLRSSGVPIRDCTSKLLIDGKLDPTESLSALRAWWLDRKTPWLILSGRAGCGKTVAAASLAAENRVCWMRADDVVRSFSAMFGEQFEKQEKAKAAHVLVVDDLGAEVDSARMLPALLELMDARVSAYSRPAVCTTNLTKREFADRYANERLNSRMRELVSWVSVSTADLRGKCG